jgi:hypothetical protein
VEGAVNMFNIEDGEPSQFFSEENPESLKDIQSYTALTDDLIKPFIFDGSADHTPQNTVIAYKFISLLQSEEGSKDVRDFAMKFDPVLGNNDALNGGILGQVYIYADAENDGGKMLSDLRSVGSRFYYSKSGTGQSSARGLGIVGWTTKNLVRAKAMQIAENGRNKDAASNSGVSSKDLEDLGSAVKAAVPTTQENQTAFGEATTSAGSVDDVLSSFVGTVPVEPVTDTRITPGEQTPADVAPAAQAAQERLEQEAKGQDPETNEQIREYLYTKVDGAVTAPTINVSKARELIAKKLGFTPKNVSYENTDIPNENGNQYSGKVNLATKQITINLRNIKDSAHLEDVLMEEMDHLVYADPMVQAEISLLSENLPDDIKAEVASLPYKPEVQREEATIRFMRRLANEPNTSSLWKRFVDSVRAAFRRLFNGRLTERDLKMAADRVAARSFRAMAAQSNRTGTRFSFAGEQSIKNLSGERRKFMADSLDAAKAMAAAGKSSEEIRAVTGWFPGTYDGKLRYEIPDSKASFASTDVYNEKTTQAYGGQAFNRITVSSMIDRVKSGKVVKLSDVFQHDELFAAYPEAANISFFPIAGNVVQGSHRVIDGKDVITATITIAADGSISAASTSTILHELQHFIQQREGFAVGGSPDNLVTASDLTDAAKFGDGMRGIQKYEAEIAGLVRVLEEERAKKSFMGFGGPNQKTIKALEDSIARVQESVNSIWAYQKKNLNIDKDSTRASLLSAINRVDSKLGGTWVLTKRNEGLDMLYRLLSGEIEARDVQARQNLTPEQLRATAPYSSENIAKEDAIVMFGSGGPQASMSMPSPEAQRIDQEYMAAVEAGDMAKAQRIVDEAAYNAGFRKKGYHGTHKDFTVFNRLFAAKQRVGLRLDTVGSWFTDSANIAKTLYGPKVVQAYLSLRNPLRFEGIGGLQNFRDEVTETHGSVENFRKWASQNGYDGVEISGDFVDGELQTVRIAFDPNQIKSADPITRDDAGNIIPPSQRFNPASSDIRYSMTPAQQRIDQEYMAAVEAGNMETAQRLINAAAKAAAKPFSVKTQRKGFSTETAVSVGDKTVSVFRDPENGYWYFADKGGLGNYIATSKENAIQAALERIEDEQGGAKASTTVQFRDWRKRTTITLPGFYLRFGDLPKGGKSVKGNQPGEFEQGVSVLKAWRSPNGVFVISSYTSETGSSDMVSGLENRPVFIAYGEDTGKVGSDGEPLLKDVVLTEQVINSLITVDDPSYIDQPITNNRTTYDKWKTIEPAPDPLASAETVVRDDAGNIIPPSKRFEEDSDIRYSLPDPNEPAPAVPDVGPDAYTEEVAAVEAIPEATKKKAKDKVKKKTKVAKEVADPNVKAVENFIAAFKRNSGVEKADAEPKAQAKAKEILARYTKLPDRKKGSGYALTEAGQDAFMYNLNQELVDLGVPIDLASEATDYAWARYSTKRQKQIDNKALAKAKKEIRERERQANRPEKEAQAALDKPNNTAKAFINKQDLSQTETLTGTKPKKIDPVAQALSDWTNVQDLSTAFDSSPQARNAYMTGLSSKLMSLGVDSQTAWTASNRAWSKYQTALSAKVEAFRRRFEANKASTILGEELSKIPVYLQNDVEFVKAYFKKLLIFGGIPEQVAEAGTTMYTARYIDLLKNVKTKRATRFIENEASAKTKKVLTEKPNEYTKLMTAVRLGVTDPSHTVSMAFSSPSKYQVFTQADHDQMIAWEKEIHDGDTPNLIKVELAKKILGLADARMNDFNAINAFTGYLVGNTLSGIGTAAIQIWTPAYSMGNRLATDGMRGLMTGDPKRFLASWSAFVNSADTVTKEFKYAFGNDVYRRGQQAELQSLSALRKVLDKNIAIYQNPKSGKEKVVAAAKIALSAPDYVRRLYSSMDSASQSLFINQIRQVGLYDLLRKNGMDMNAFNTMLEAKRAHRDGIITTLTLEGNYTPTQIRLIAEDSAIEDFGARVAAAIGNDGAKQVRDLFRTSVTEGKSDIGVNDEVDGHVIPAILKILKGIESSVDAVAGEKGQGAGQLAFRVIVGYPTTALKVLNRSLYFFPPTAASRYLLNRYYEKQPGFDPEAKRVYPLLETHSQKLQRLAEAAMGTMALTILIGLLWDDKDKEEKDRRFIVHNLGPSDRAAKQAWRAAGNVPQSIQWRASETSPWISVSWAKAGLEALAPVLATVGTITDVGDQATEDTTLSDNIIGSIGGVMGVFNRPLSGINDIGEILSGEKNSVSQKSLASYTAFRASGLVPFSSLLKTVNRMEGPRDMSTPTSTMLSQIPIAGPMLTEPAINMFGDPLGATPNELSYKLPIFPVQVGIRRQDVPFYEKILSKGQYPPLKLRTNFEKTYGPVSDLVWRQYVEKRGQMVKKLIIDRWTDLDKLSPEAYDKVLGKFANAADDVAIQELNIRRLPK